MLTILRSTDLVHRHHVDEFSLKVAYLGVSKTLLVGFGRIGCNLIIRRTQLLWCSSGQRQQRLTTATLIICPTTVAPVSSVPVFSVHDLSIFVDSGVVRRTHVYVSDA